MFNTDVVAWISDIVVEISNGTRPSGTVLSDVNQISAVRILTSKELHLGYFRATRYTADSLTRDPALDTMAGPYAAGNPNTIGVKTRNICPVLHPFLGLWLLNEDGMTWQKFFGTIYPAIMNKVREAN